MACGCHRCDSLPGGSSSTKVYSTFAPQTAEERGTASGCGVMEQAIESRVLETTDGRGEVRRFEVVVPSGVRPGEPKALTFVFHGADGGSNSARAMGLEAVPGAREASFFVYPVGVPFGRQGIGWDDTCGGYDMVFFDHMLSEIRKRYCVDSRRVFAAGFSWGADFVTALLCCRGDRLRAVAPASCSDEYAVATDHKTYANYPCPSRSSAAIRFTHDANGDSGYSLAQFETTRRLYQEFNGCSQVSTAALQASCVSYVGCREPFIACGYTALGHAIPRTWASDTWAFFSTFH